MSTSYGYIEFSVLYFLYFEFSLDLGILFLGS